MFEREKERVIALLGKTLLLFDITFKSNKFVQTDFLSMELGNISEEDIFRKLFVEVDLPRITKIREFWVLYVDKYEGCKNLSRKDFYWGRLSSFH